MNHVDRTTRIRILIIQRRWHEGVLQSENGSDEFHSARPCAQVTKLTLEGGDGYIAECLTNGLSFSSIAEHGTDTVRIHVTDI